MYSLVFNADFVNVYVRFSVQNVPVGGGCNVFMLCRTEQQDNLKNTAATKVLVEDLCQLIDLCSLYALLRVPSLYSFTLSIYLKRTR